MEARQISLTVNGRRVEVRVPPDRLLIDLLREDLGLKGTKRGCDTGDCGACTVILNGRAVNACLIFAARLDGAALTTVEGLGTPDALHPLQQAFIAEGALQCGYCGPGMLTNAAALLAERQGGTLDAGAVRRTLAGNLCRCTGYVRIVRAILKAAAATGIAVTDEGDERGQERGDEGGGDP